MHRLGEKGEKISTPAQSVAPTPGVGGVGSSAGELTGGTTTGTGARGFNGGCSIATERPTATISPGDGGMDCNADVPGGGITTGTDARGEGGLARPSTPGREAYDNGGGEGRRVAYSRECSLSIGKYKRPPNRWTPVASRVIARFAWTMRIDSKLADMAGTNDTVSRMTRTPCLLRNIKSKLPTYSTAWGVPSRCPLWRSRGRGGAGCTDRACSGLYGSSPFCLAIQLSLP